MYTGEVSVEAIVEFGESMIPSKVNYVNAIEEWNQIRESFPAFVKVLLITNDTSLDMPLRYYSYKYNKRMVFAVTKVQENNTFVSVYNVTKFPSIVIVKVSKGLLYV